MQDLKAMLKKRARQNGMLVVVLVIVLFFQVITKGVILRPMNIANLVMQNAYVIILATGMMCCILTGGNVDLSVGSLCAFSGALCGLLMIGKGLNTWLVLMIVFGVAILIGVWNGGSIARVCRAALHCDPGLPADLPWRHLYRVKGRFLHHLPSGVPHADHRVYTGFLRRQDASHHHHAAGHRSLRDLRTAGREEAGEKAQI